MKSLLMALPICILLGLLLVGILFYRSTQARAACEGSDCDSLSDTEYIDLALEARTS